MGYDIDFGVWGGIFAVPTALADKHLKLCGEHPLKVLLLALRDAPNPVDIRYIAKRLGMTPDEVCDCLDYWQAAGIFQKTEDGPATPARVMEWEQPPEPAAAKPSAPAIPPTRETGPGGQKITTVHSRSKLTPSQIGEMSKGDKNIPFLLQELQQRLGKPLSPAQSEAIIYTYSYFELTPDYILMAAEYCNSIGKGNISYINQVIAGWVAQGVDTHDRAEELIKSLAARATNEGLVRSMFGITERSLTQKEKDYIDSWFHTLGFSPEVIRLAYERTVDNTGKLSFGYLNTILTRWSEKGVVTIRDAMTEMAGAPKGKGKAEAGGNSSFDLQEIQRLMALRSEG